MAKHDRNGPLPPAQDRPSAMLVVLVFVGVTLWAGLGAGARATYGARMTADEPQYVLSAISLAEDLDLDISDELADERWRPFHEAELPRQTQPLADGSERSPHDPLLPALLAPAVGMFGWVGARATMAVVAGALASLLVWTAIVRLRVQRGTALVVVAAFALSAPLAAYGSQIYPELVAALAVTAAAAALLGPPSRGRTAMWVAAVVALPWLGIKYAPVAAALALVGLWVERRANGRPRVGVVTVVFGVAGAAYLAFHQAVYGGWTVYAAGDHFTGREFTVVGQDPDHLGRTIRLLGLLVDRDFGLVAWAPVYLLAVPALAALIRSGSGTSATSWTSRSASQNQESVTRWVLALPLAAGWATATWVALTMHGWWWPGRQTVVVVPLAVLAVARFVDGRARLVAVAAAAGSLGALSWLWLVVETTFGSITLIFDFDRTSNPWIRLWRLVLPDERTTGIGTVALNVVWVLLVVVLAAIGWRRPGRSAGADEDAFAGEGADADGGAVDADRGRPVRR